MIEFVLWLVATLAGSLIGAAIALCAIRVLDR